MYDADIQLSCRHERDHVRITLQVTCVQLHVSTMLCVNYTVFTSQYFKWIARLLSHGKQNYLQCIIFTSWILPHHVQFPTCT